MEAHVCEAASRREEEWSNKAIRGARVMDVLEWNAIVFIIILVNLLV